jgi:PLP dependent protein
MVESALQALTDRIASAAVRAGRDPGEVTLLAVTKTQPRATIDAAMRAGILVFGENRVQEAAAKYGDLASSVELHLIGHLQRNKAREIPGLFSWVESIDSFSTADALSRRCDAAGWECSVLVQYNCSGESSKSGYREQSRLLEEAPRIARLPGIVLRGVMTIGPFGADERRIAEGFANTRSVYEAMRAELHDDRVDTLSMGMTDDFEIAIAQGSTEVRIGSALFGARG